MILNCMIVFPTPRFDIENIWKLKARREREIERDRGREIERER